MDACRLVEVALGERRYPIRIGAGLLRDGAALRALLPGRHVLLVTDRNVAAHHLPPVAAAIADHVHRIVVLPPGEQEKTLARFAELMQALADLRASRDACVLALGGGVIGDLSGFAAACWMRGVRFVQLPTTLLAMVDSSVGGKTAVDLPSGKNLVGAFHQPGAVIADTDTLATLPDRELRAGLAEVVKYAALGDAGFFEWLDARAEALLARDAEALAETIEICCRHKAAIVARDETEQGERALLNLGHTFGHALEVEAGYGELLHGEGVAIGMVCAARLSQRLGLATPGDGDRLESLLARLGLPTRIPAGLAPERLLAAMRLDKKALSGALRLILWRGMGRAEIVDSVDETAICEALIACRAAD
ncbi:MAG: 3-dehydroquinate synthase [Lysobacteraceae bacterium]